MIDYKQKDKSTHIRSHIRWIFEHKSDRLEKDLYKIAKEFGKYYFYNLPIVKINVTIYDKWTQLGPSGNLEIKLDPNFMIAVGCYHDGWHIKLRKTLGRELDTKIKKEIFGNVNRNDIWTQETEKVPHMMGELYKELKNYLGEN